MEDWEAFADAAGYRKPYVMGRMRSLADAILGCVVEVGNGLVEQGGNPAHLERIVAAIQSNTRPTALPPLG